MEESFLHEIPLRRGARKGCILQSFLFNVYTPRSIGGASNVSLNGKPIDNLRCADDPFLIADCLQELIDHLRERSEERG